MSIMSDMDDLYGYLLRREEELADKYWTDRNNDAVVSQEKVQDEYKRNKIYTEKELAIYLDNKERI